MKTINQMTIRELDYYARLYNKSIILNRNHFIVGLRSFDYGTLNLPREAM